MSQTYSLCLLLTPARYTLPVHGLISKFVFTASLSKNYTWCFREPSEDDEIKGGGKEEEGRYTLRKTGN